MGKAKIYYSDKQKFGNKTPVKSVGNKKTGKSPLKKPMILKKPVNIIRKQDQSPKNKKIIVKPGAKKTNDKSVNSSNNNNKVLNAIQTAKAIAKSNHPKSKEIQQLLQTKEKGWIDNDKFMQILKPLII